MAINHDSLTLRELEVTEEIINTANIDLAAKKLFISRTTVTTHLNSIYKKLDIHSVAELIKFFYEKEFDRLTKENRYLKMLFIQNKNGVN